MQYKQTNHSPGKLSWAENPCVGKVSWAETPLAGKGILGRKISHLERYPGQRNLCPEMVTGKGSLPGKGFLGREISAR